MITKEQIEKYCGYIHCGAQIVVSRKLWARLNNNYQIDDFDEQYVVPAGTLVQVVIYTNEGLDLYMDGYFIAGIPYDAATLLEDE